MRSRILIAGLLLVAACAPENSKGPCGPNVVDKGLSLSVKRLGSSDDYSMELCAPASPPGTYAVYGAINHVELLPANLSPAASIRTDKIIANNTGDMIQVRFHGTDRYFAIYRYKNANGDLVLDQTEEGSMVTPHLLPEK